MSIIQDALKKVESSREAPKKFADIPNIKPSLEVPRHSNKKAKTFVPAAVFTVLLISIIVVLRQPSVTVAKSSANNIQSAHETILKPIIAEPYVKPDYSFLSIKNPSLDGFVLSGVMQLPGGPRAIVNNVMVEVGDTVGGAVVKEIRKNNVVLKVKGSELTLDMKG